MDSGPVNIKTVQNGPLGVDLESEKQFRNLIDQSPYAIELMIPDGKIAYVNPAYLRLWDLTEDSMAQVQENYNMLNDEQIVNLGLMPLVEKAYKGEKITLPAVQYSASQTMVEIGLPNYSNSEPWIQCHFYPIKDENGGIQYIVVTYMDVTELRMAEAEMLRQRENLLRINRAGSLGHLAGSIAHELNQPLTGILSNAQAAQILIQQDPCDKEELVNALFDISSDTKRAAEVIHNLRELFRENRVVHQSLDVNEIITDTIRLFHSEFVLKHTRVITELHSSLPRVNANRIQIQQVLMNLILNGLQAMLKITGRNHCIHIGSDYIDKEIRVWVDDNGTGIATETIDEIFNPMKTFRQGGTGMGLAISHSIIESHDGRMWAENRETGGARVGFVIPVNKEA